MTLNITRTIIKDLTPEQLVEMMNDETVKVNAARLKFNEWSGKFEFGGDTPVERRRKEFLAALDIAEPIVLQFADENPEKV